jgi:hypothetical protein
MHCSVKIMSYMSQKLDLSNDVDLGFNYEPHNLDQGYVSLTSWLARLVKSQL